jgi:hypothetical protein
MTKSQAAKHAPAKPLSPALDKTFKIGLVLKGLDDAIRGHLPAQPRPAGSHRPAGRPGAKR